MSYFLCTGNTGLNQFNMMNLIPQSFRSKMGMYDIEIEGANVKVSIVDSPDLVGTKMDDLRSSLLSRKNKIK